jgi:hypothetical protein
VEPVACLEGGDGRRQRWLLGRASSVPPCHVSFLGALRLDASRSFPREEVLPPCHDEAVSLGRRATGVDRRSNSDLGFCAPEAG